MRFKIDWASPIVGSKFTFLLCVTWYLRAIFLVQDPGGAYIWRGNLTEGFFALSDWGAYIWRGLFSEFYRNQEPMGSCCNAKKLSFVRFLPHRSVSMILHRGGGGG